MDKTEAITNADKLREVERIRRYIVKRAEERMAELMKEAQEDFCTFFRWYAPAMYKLKMRHEYFAGMPEIKAESDLAGTRQQLRLRIKVIEGLLIDSSAFGRCADETGNLEHRLKQDAERDIRDILKDMVFMLEY